MRLTLLFALVVQWIGQELAELQIEVRLLSRAQLKIPLTEGIFCCAQIKSIQTFSIILPNLIHKSRKRNLKK